MAERLSSRSVASGANTGSHSEPTIMLMIVIHVLCNANILTSLR